MAINFPNDPATDPGDGNTWVDPDGNTWLVEIVSGEAIWTMTEAADTGGGGGGAVDSVNGETGVVSLGIQDMDDYEAEAITPWNYTAHGDSDPFGDGEISFLSNNLRLNFKDADGISHTTEINAQTPPYSIWVTAGGNTVEATVLSQTTSASYKSLSTGFDWWPYTNPSEGDPVSVSLSDPNVPLPLAGGDVLQWNDTTQKFQPTQPAAGTPLDGLLSVDGDAVTYGTAPTLGVDATDLVIPTMGQVRGAIASNGGTSVSLNDLSDVSYSSGDLTVTGLTDITFEGDGKISDGNINELTFTTTGLTSTGNFDAPLVSTNEVKLKSGSNHISLNAPALVEDTTFNLPAVDGQSGYVLSTDGGGNLTFTAPPNPAEAVRQYDIDYEGLTAYKFTGPGLDGTEENPAIYVSRGDGIVFSNLLGAHPFQLQTVAGTGEEPYTDGVTGAQPISIGSFTWVVPMDAPSTLFYQCTAHTAMSGVIYVLDNSDGGGGGAVESVNSQTGVVSLGIQDMDDYELTSLTGVFTLPKKESSSASVNALGDWAVFSSGLFIYYWENETTLVDNLSVDDEISLQVPGMATPHVATINSFGTNGPAVAMEISVAVPSEIIDAPLGTRLTITSSSLPGSSVPLAEGDTLQWNDTDKVFNPVALVDNDTKRIQDMDDYAQPSNVVYFSSKTDQSPPAVDQWDNSNGNLVISTDVTRVFGVIEAGDAITFNSPGLDQHATTVAGVFPQSSPPGRVIYTFAADLPAAYQNAPLGTPLELSSPEITPDPAPVQEGDILQWNDTTQKFQPTQPSSSPSALDDLTDVDADSPTEGDTLTWDGTSWKPTAPPTGPSRQTVTITTAALNQGQTQAGEITGTGATGLLLSVQTDVAAWIRIYTDASSSTADAGRTKDDDPVPGSGVLFEALYTTFTEKPVTPGTTYFNLVGDDKLYWRITNESALTGTLINVTLKLLPLE